MFDSFFFLQNKVWNNSNLAFLVIGGGGGLGLLALPGSQSFVNAEVKRLGSGGVRDAARGRNRRQKRNVGTDAAAATTVVAKRSADRILA